MDRGFMNECINKIVENLPPKIINKEVESKDLTDVEAMDLFESFGNVMDTFVGHHKTCILKAALLAQMLSGNPHEGEREKVMCGCGKHCIREPNPDQEEPQEEPIDREAKRFKK